MRTIIASFIGVLSVVAVTAQTMSTEITVDRTVDPEVTAATPLSSVTPATLPLNLPNVALNISEFDGGYGLHQMPQSINTQIYSGLPEPQRNRGYVSLGYFPTYRLGAQAGYRIVDNSKTLIQASARFGGFSYHSYGRLCSDNNADIDARVIQRVGAHVLDVEGLFGYMGVRHPSGEGLEQKQTYKSARCKIRFERSERRYGYGMRASLEYIGGGKDIVCGTTLDPLNVRPSKNTIADGAISGRIGGDSGKHSFVIDARLRNLHRSGFYVKMFFNGQHWYTMPKEPYRDNSAIVTATPAYQLRTRKLNLRVGVDVNSMTGRNYDWHLDMNGGKHNHKLLIMPSLDVSWNPWSSLRVCASWSSGMDFNTLSERLAYSPFTPAFEVGEAVRDKIIDLEGGISYGGFVGLHAEAKGGFQRWNSCMRPVYCGPNLQGWAFAESQLTNVWGEVSIGYEASRRMLHLAVDCSVKVSRGGDEYGTPEEPDMATTVAKTKISLRPIEPLKVSLGYDYRGGRRCYEICEYKYMKLDAVSNLSLNVSYKVNEKLHLGLDVQNILCKRYIVFPGLQSPSLTGMLGATYTF